MTVLTNTGHFCDGTSMTRPPSPYGVEIQGVYDGVLFWACPACGFAWHRFGPANSLHHRAAPHVQRWNVERGHTR